MAQVPRTRPLTPQDALLLGFAVLGPLQEAGRAVGITLSQAALLVALAAGPEMTAAEVSRALGITSGPVTSLTARLLARRLIRRRPDPSDLRSVLFGITGAGREILAAYRQAASDLLGERLDTGYQLDDVLNI